MRLRASVAAFELPLTTFVKSGLSENFRVIRKVKKIQGNSKRQNGCAFPGRIWMVAVGQCVLSRYFEIAASSTLPSRVGTMNSKFEVGTQGKS